MSVEAEPVMSEEAAPGDVTERDQTGADAAVTKPDGVMRGVGPEGLQKMPLDQDF
jgi:hypothetical protein